MTIRDFRPDDWVRMAKIFEQGIKTNLATFRPTIPTYEEWDATHVKDCRFIAELDGKIVGWASLSLHGKNSAYDGVAEDRIYIGKGYSGSGVGTALLSRLIAESEKLGFHTLEAIIIAENAASLHIHEKCGFRTVGYHEKIAKTPDGVWHDTVILERRSKVIDA